MAKDPERLSPKHKTLDEMSRTSTLLINRLAIAFPGFFDGYEVNNLQVNFSEPLCNGIKPTVSTIYDGTTLTGVTINKHLMGKLYHELDVDYKDLVRTNVGMVVCLDAVFQKLLRDSHDPRVTEVLTGFLFDTQAVPQQLKAAFAGIPERHSIDEAWQAIIQQDGVYNTDLIAHINAQRLALGMIIAAEQQRFGAEPTKSVVEAVRLSIIDSLINKAKSMRIAGYAMTKNIELATSVAAQSILDPELIAYAAPCTVEEIHSLIKKMNKATRSYEIPYGESIIMEVSEGYSDTAQDPTGGFTIHLPNPHD